MDQTKSAASRPDVIVVLGAAVWAGHRPSPTLARRISAAAVCFEAGPAGYVIACGGLGEHPPTEAEVIRKELVAAGVPEARILLEDRSTTTMENARFAIKIMQAQGLNKPIVVTDGYHLTRALMTFRMLGVPARGYTVARRSGTPIPVRMWSWLREALAIPLYMLRLVWFRIGNEKGAP